MTLREQANEILAQAEKRGIANSFYFATTFRRYQVQINILLDLERAIRAGGKDAARAIGQYNKTSSAANNTVQTLIGIVRQLRGEERRGRGSGQQW